MTYLKTQPKPIFLIGIEGTNAKLASIQKQLENKFEDYYVLIYPSKESEPQFKVLNNNNIDDINFEELKKIILDSLC